MNIEMQRDILIWMLNRVKSVKAHQRELEERLNRIRMERECPIGSPGYDPLPRSTGTGSGAASILFKMAGIEDELYDQKKALADAYVEVMDIIDFIPAATVERRIFELRYIDGMGMRDVADRIMLHFTNAYEKHNRTIDQLLTYEFIQEKISENEPAYLEWFCKRDEKDRKRRRKEKESQVTYEQPRQRKRKRKRRR